MACASWKGQACKEEAVAKAAKQLLVFNQLIPPKSLVVPALVEQPSRLHMPCLAATRCRQMGLPLAGPVQRLWHEQARCSVGLLLLR